jgi:hypothetical protein
VACEKDGDKKIGAVDEWIGAEKAWKYGRRLRGEDWRVGRGGSGERGYGMHYVRRVALCYAHAGHAGLRSTYRIPSEASELSRLTIRYSLRALLFPPLVFIQRPV